MRALFACYRWVWITVALAALLAVADIYERGHLEGLVTQHAGLLMAADNANAVTENLSQEQIEALLRPVDMRQWGARLAALAAEQELRGFVYHLSPVKSDAPVTARYQLTLSFNAPSDTYVYAFFSRLSDLGPGRLAFDGLDMERSGANPQSGVLQGGVAGALPSALNVRATMDWITNPPLQLSQNTP